METEYQKTIDMYQHIADEWKAKAVKHLATLTKVSEILAENESGHKWIKDIVKVLLDANIMDVSETEAYKL